MSVNAQGKNIYVDVKRSGAAWHSLGYRNEIDQTAMETLNMFDGHDGVPIFELWKDFAKSPDGEMHETGDFRIYRLPTKTDDKYIPIGWCTDSYHLVQAEDIAKKFDEKVKKPVETMGFLNHGERMFVTWQLKKGDVIVGKDDKVTLFGTILGGFDGKMSITLAISGIRTVCSNTFQMVVNQTKHKKSDGTDEGLVWNGKHNSPYILNDLGEWMSHIDQKADRQAELISNLFNRMKSIPVDSENVLKSIVESVYEFSEAKDAPKKIIERNAEALAKKNEIAERDRNLAYELFNNSSRGIAITPDMWGLWNVFTQIENHERLSKKDDTSSVFIGNRANTMKKALNVIVNHMDGK
jgi:hypothetical protein